MKNLLNKIKCAVVGHQKWKSGQALPRFIQAKTEGNGTVEVHVCTRCNSMFAEFGQLTPEELQQEEELQKALGLLNSTSMKSQMSNLEQEIKDLLGGMGDKRKDDDLLN